jgi:hypothetical protein
MFQLSQTEKNPVSGLPLNADIAQYSQAANPPNFRITLVRGVLARPRQREWSLYGVDLVGVRGGDEGFDGRNSCTTLC